MLKVSYLDNFIILLMFALLPVDMVNGILLKNGINLPISIGQFFKLLILFFLFFRFLFYPKLLLVPVILALLLLLPTFYQFFKGFDEPFIFADVIKISKYLTPLLSFLFFVSYIKQNGSQGIEFLFKLVQFSYYILIGNIFLKYLGLGYPMYEFGNIGSKGYFYAGNEVSGLLVILTSILAFRIWKNESKFYYLLFAALTLFAGLTVSSKTGVAGILLVLLIVPLKKPSMKISLKRLLFYISSVVTLVPLSLFLMWRSIQNSDLMIRLIYFSEKFDFLTFILSNRNVFFKIATENYVEKYDVIEKVIGVGQTKYEYLNVVNTVEIDILDIFFAYGFIGLLSFIVLMTFLVIQSIRFSKNGNYPLANFALFVILLLLGISSTAGHIFSSGMAAIFIGLLFALMYYKQEIVEESFEETFFSEKIGSHNNTKH